MSVSVVVDLALFIVFIECTGRPAFVYVYHFQTEYLETYESQLKHKKDFPLTITTDLETTTRCNRDIEGGSMFATSYMMMVNFYLSFEKISSRYLKKAKKKKTRTN